MQDCDYGAIIMKRFNVTGTCFPTRHYNERGEEQIAGYLDYFHAKKGYLVSFCFNKSKSLQTQTIQVGGKTVYEAVV